MSEFEREAHLLDEKYGNHQELFVFPTFSSMGLKIGDLTEEQVSRGKTQESPINYLCGNSLGLMPKTTVAAVDNELRAWGLRGVEAHFRHPMKEKGLTDWVDIDLPAIPYLAKIVGAQECEVACMGTLTMNLNSLLSSFYRPTRDRYKILFERHAFPSDYYAMLNQVKLQGHQENALIQLSSRKGEFGLRTEDILAELDKEGDSIAVVCFSGIQYYTGQYFDIERITEAAHKKGCIVGWDLAHAFGNVELQLHNWNVDFAAWCSYKYMNSGPGAIGGIFVHERHVKAERWRARPAGWWGNRAENRFDMKEHFEPSKSALSFRQSNPSVIDVVSLVSALKTFEKCGEITVLRRKSKTLTSYLEKMLKSSKYYTEHDNIPRDRPFFTIITPSNPEQRGAQLSLFVGPEDLDHRGNVMPLVFDYLNNHGVICDDRKPNVIRIAPVPSYNSFLDCFECVRVLNKAFEEVENLDV